LNYVDQRQYFTVNITEDYSQHASGGGTTGGVAKTGSGPAATSGSAAADRGAAAGTLGSTSQAVRDGAASAGSGAAASGESAAASGGSQARAGFAKRYSERARSTLWYQGSGVVVLVFAAIAVILVLNHTWGLAAAGFFIAVGILVVSTLLLMRG
jgi:hypothetical protein